MSTRKIKKQLEEIITTNWTEYCNSGLEEKNPLDYMTVNVVEEGKCYDEEEEEYYIGDRFVVVEFDAEKIMKDNGYLENIENDFHYFVNLLNEEMDLPNDEYRMYEPEYEIIRRYSKIPSPGGIARAGEVYITQIIDVYEEVVQKIGKGHFDPTSEAIRENLDFRIIEAIRGFRSWTKNMVVDEPIDFAKIVEDTKKQFEKNISDIENDVTEAEE